MSFGLRCALGAVLLALGMASAAEAAPPSSSPPPATAASHPRNQVGELLGRFHLRSLRPIPRSVRTGGAIRARGRVTNLDRRRAQTGRLTFSLRRSRKAQTADKAASGIGYVHDRTSL